MGAVFGASEEEVEEVEDGMNKDHLVGQDLLVDDPEEEWTVFDKYEIGRLLGSGAFGQVRVCRPLHSKDDTDYAVKIVDCTAEARSETEVFMSVRDEVQILQRLNHPHVIRLLDTFEDEIYLYVVMELVPGGELFKAIAEPAASVQERDVANIGQELLEALSYLHKTRVVHRDVKAENVMLQQAGVLGTIKLIDFGLAAVLETPPCAPFAASEPEPLTLICGTPPYAAPELWAASYGPKVDVWAAGVMLYLALYGKYPFFSKDLSQIQEAICDEQIEPAYAVDEATRNPYAVSDIGVTCLASMLSKDPADRPSANEALSDPWFSTKRRAIGTAVPLEVRQQAFAVTRQKPKVSFATDQRRTKDVEAKQAAARAAREEKLAKAKIQTRSLKSIEYSNGHDGDEMVTATSAPNGGCLGC
eukprot:gnl/MRDRNA2_/MRDRNA2_34882_c0_seq1.p1 gnl/MRDRNA2_/MRDRNA2_34882_c0~~gnl/MRDRNA2_/MRDRNA2_34882_c0_seq1.p1  ORF type:complete len:417 (-),score=113.22 gnl/MRDRNA2_/MRDRNA2_34882_c0_seq1:6-1256(-)